MQNSLRIPLLCWLKEGPFKNHSTWPSYAVHFRLTKRNWITGKELLLKQTNFSSVRLIQNAFRRKKKLKNKISSSTLRVHSEVWEQMKQKFIKKKKSQHLFTSLLFFSPYFKIAERKELCPYLFPTLWLLPLANTVSQFGPKNTQTQHKKESHGLPVRHKTGPPSF